VVDPVFMRLSLIGLSVFCVCALPLTLTAAEKKPAKEARTADASSADAEAAFARQAGKVPATDGAQPVVIGAYVWGGRADENYKPFFQWDLRIQAGTADIDGLKGRTITLNPDGSDAAVGAWQELGRIANTKSSDVHLRQNCPAFQSYRLELEWSGGSQTFVSADKTSVPVSSASFAQMAYLVTTGYMHDPEESKADQKKRKGKKKGFEVSWWLWNVGGADATDVVQTVRFLDLGGKEVAREVVKLKDPVKGGARMEQTLSLKEPPKGYQLLSVSAECATPLVAIGPEMGFTGAAEVEIAGIAISDGKVSAKVRNGLAKDLSGLAINITLLDANGKALETVKIPVGDLASKAEATVTGAVKATEIMGFEVGWEIAASP
jgi:hypothetical protein